MAIGETVLGAVLQVVFDRLASQEVIHFFHRSKFDQSLVHKLKIQMLAVEKLLLDAEKKQMTDEAVKRWFEELKHWFYRAEEVADQIATEALQSSLERNLPSEPQSLACKVRNWTLAFNPSSSFLNTFSLNIKEIVEMLEIMLHHKEALGLRELSEGRAPQKVPTVSLVGDSEIYGRDSEKEKMLEWLLSEEKRISVAAIVGMGGLGKTTLAKMVYNDRRLQETFELKAWVCISDQFDIPQITRSILESVTHELFSGSPNLNFLQNKLSSELRNKKFLFVLDDVWNEKYEDWEILRAPFHGGADGSKIIVTTRNHGVAFTMSTHTAFLLRPLSNDDAWSLFLRHAFELENLKANSCLEHIGRKIVRKCKGLPLAIKTLGGLLRCTRSNKDWETILQSSLWDLPHEKSNVIPALWLSYYYLPGYLKRCFSYCAIFSKDYKIDCKQLVFLWMAEGFVLPTDNERRLEDVGNEYLRELVSRSFLEEMDESYVIMHDLLLELAQGICGKFMARSHELGSMSTLYKRARHFSYEVYLYDVINKFQGIHETKYLRTFLQLHAVEFGYLTNNALSVLNSSLSCLRVLSLSGYENLRLPESMECPKQLRYLDISHTKINLLPEWVNTLCNLQTLILSGCFCLKSLPADIWKLVSLRHLDIRGATLLSHMPRQLSSLTGLQTLTDFFVGRNIGSGIHELKELRQICGKFAIRQLQNVTVPSDSFASDLSSKFIDDLELEFDSEEMTDSNKDRDVLESVKPPLELERLTLMNYAGTRFPRWLDPGCVDYYKMVFLCLSGCRYCITLPPLGLLPSLRKLEIEEMEYVTEVGSEFYGHNSRVPFPALETLSFKHMKEWERWSSPNVQGGLVYFTCLMELYLFDCPKLKGDIPVHVSSLKKVEICGCEEFGGLLPWVSSIQVLNMTTCPRVQFTGAFNGASITTLRLVGLRQLVNLPHELVTLSFLSKLEIRECDNLESLANVQLAPALKSLVIEDCRILESLPEAMDFLTSLQELWLSRCQCLKWVSGNSLPISLNSLLVHDCDRWEFPIPIERMQYYTLLEELSFVGQGNHFVSFPIGIFPILRSLVFGDCKDLEKVYIPEGMVGNDLTFIDSLQIFRCPKLEMIGKETGERAATILPAPNLTYLGIRDCDNLRPLLMETEGDVWLPKLTWLRMNKSKKMTPVLALSLIRSLLRFSSLRMLEIRGVEIECFPVHGGAWGSLPDSLCYLYIEDFPNLRKLDGKPLQSLKYLQELTILSCPMLECLPEEGLPHSLGLLRIEGCPMVEERCQPEKGQYWSKISHIPCVIINCFCITGA